MNLIKDDIFTSLQQLGQRLVLVLAHTHTHHITIH